MQVRAIPGPQMLGTGGTHVAAGRGRERQRQPQVLRLRLPRIRVANPGPQASSAQDDAFDWGSCCPALSCKFCRGLKQKCPKLHDPCDKVPP